MIIDNTRIVAVPAIPEQIYRFIYDLRTTHRTIAPFLRWHVEVGDLVTAGQVVAEYDLTSLHFSHKQLRAVIYAPVDGKIEKINAMPDGIVANLNDKGDFDNALFLMSPKQDAYLNISIRQTYTDFSDYCFERGANSENTRILKTFESNRLMVSNK